ncbi:MAG: recombinase family protein [Burkholderiaceae bacterium]|jgi:hypothetical protein
MTFSRTQAVAWKLRKLVEQGVLARQNTCPVRGIFLGGEKRSRWDFASPGLCERLGYTIVQEYTDGGISGAKSRNDRPALDALMRDATRHRCDMVMCSRINRLGRSILIHAPKS